MTSQTQDRTMSLDAPTVDAVLDEYFDAAVERARALGPDYVDLWQSLRLAATGGRRLRPTLVVEGHRHLGGRRPEAASTVGAAIELLHTAFVVHDDVIDHDDVRRGRPNVSGTFAGRARTAGASPARAGTIGAAAGILAGDLALAGAHRLLATLPTGPGLRHELLDLLDHAVVVSASGEFDDVRYGVCATEVSLAEALTMETRKTAVYSFELPLRAGAVLAGTDGRTVDGLGALGRTVGLAFQLVDDLDGLFGDEAVIGKSVVTDLREGKVTPLMAHARSTAQWDRIRVHLGGPTPTGEDLARVRALLEESGSRAAVTALARERLSTAGRMVGELAVPPAYVDWFRGVLADLGPDHAL